MAGVGIGLPTYNGAAYLRECLACLQGQSFEDFEVFISDNASTDETSDICDEVARSDGRFRHVRFSENVSAQQNFTRALSGLGTSYFMWRADDDLTDANHLARLVEGLNSGVSAELAVCPILRTSGDPKTETRFDLPTLYSDRKNERVRDLLLGCRPSWFYGLWRRDAVAFNWKYVNDHYPHLWAADHLTMLPSILKDRVALVKDTLFIQRIRDSSYYRLDPVTLLRARRSYKSLAAGFMEDAGWVGEDSEIVERALYTHMQNRVAPIPKTYRRAAKYAIMKTLARIFRSHA